MWRHSHSEQIDEAYQVLKQGKALRLVQTGEDIREGYGWLEYALLSI